MKAMFGGRDYILVLEKEARELEKLKSGQRLEANLIGVFDHQGDLGKNVILEFAENNGPDGFDFKYLPPNASCWDEIKTVRVKINSRAYDHIERRGSFGTRYNGSDKIEIHTKDPFTDF